VQISVSSRGLTADSGCPIVENSAALALVINQGTAPAIESPGAGDEYKVWVQLVERGIVQNMRRSDLTMRSMATKNGKSKAITAISKHVRAE
jgi:hypothetical protein